MSIDERAENALLSGRFALLWLAGIFVAAAVPTLPVDCPVSLWCRAGSLPGDIRDLLNFMEIYGHGLGVLLIALIIHQLDPGSRWALPRVLSVALGAGLAANVIKMLVSRVRPLHFDYSSGVLASFDGWLPMGRTGSIHQSFPSAHTATAVGLAFVLVWLYPRGRWLFHGLAVCVALQRIAASSHFPSDTLCGAAVGCVVATFLLRAGPLPNRFDSWERGWRKPVDPCIANERGPNERGSNERGSNERGSNERGPNERGQGPVPRRHHLDPRIDLATINKETE